MALEALGDKAGAAEMYRHSQSLAPDWAAPGNALAKLSGDAPQKEEHVPADTKAALMDKYFKK